MYNAPLYSRPLQVLTSQRLWEPVGVKPVLRGRLMRLAAAGWRESRRLRQLFSTCGEFRRPPRPVPVRAPPPRGGPNGAATPPFTARARRAGPSRRHPPKAVVGGGRAGTRGFDSGGVPRPPRETDVRTPVDGHAGRDAALDAGVDRRRRRPRAREHGPQSSKGADRRECRPPGVGASAGAGDSLRPAWDKNARTERRTPVVPAYPASFYATGGSVLVA